MQSLCNSDFVCGRGSLWETLSTAGAFQYPASHCIALHLLRHIFQDAGIPTTGCEGEKLLNNFTIIFSYWVAEKTIQQSTSGYLIFLTLGLVKVLT